jgi:hypothetical protein
VTAVSAARADAAQIRSVIPYADLAARVRAAPPRLGPVRLVAVDGGAGSGKTSFAERLAVALDGAPVVHTDDLLDGWGDLEASWPRLEAQVLRPLACGRAARWQRYDWLTGSFAEWHDLPASEVLIVEGVGSARRQAQPHLSLSVWVQAPRAVRVERGITRDGPELFELFLTWLDGEAVHHEREGTPDRADLVVDGAPGLLHDPRFEFVALAGRADAAGTVAG